MPASCLSKMILKGKHRNSLLENPDCIGKQQRGNLEISLGNFAGKLLAEADAKNSQTNNLGANHPKLGLQSPHKSGPAAIEKGR